MNWKKILEEIEAKLSARTDPVDVELYDAFRKFMSEEAQGKVPLQSLAALPEDERRTLMLILDLFAAIYLLKRGESPTIEKRMVPAWLMAFGFDVCLGYIYVLKQLSRILPCDRKQSEA